ncbi:MAG: DUF6326 family protein [Flavobacteriales bacterium]
MKAKKDLLTYLWLFLVLNYLYCDVVGLMDANLLSQYLKGSVNGVAISADFLFSASVLMELPIGMVLISKLSPYKINRMANMIVSFLMTSVQVTTLFLGKPTSYYIFFSVIEVATSVAIFMISLKWKNEN